MDPFVYKRAPDLFAGNTAKLPPAPPLPVAAAPTEGTSHPTPVELDAWADVRDAALDEVEVAGVPDLESGLDIGFEEVELEPDSSAEVAYVGTTDSGDEEIREAAPVDPEDAPQDDSEIYASGEQSEFQVPLVSDVNIVPSPPSGVPSVQTPVDAAAIPNSAELVDSDPSPMAQLSSPPEAALAPQPQTALPESPPTVSDGVPLAPEEPVIKAGTLVDGVNPFPHSLLAKDAFPHSLLQRDASGSHDSPPAAPTPEIVQPVASTPSAPPRSRRGRRTGAGAGARSGRRRQRGSVARAPGTRSASESGITSAPPAVSAPGASSDIGRAPGAASGVGRATGSSSGIGNASSAASGIGRPPGASSGVGKAPGAASGIGRASGIGKAPGAAGKSTRVGSASSIGKAPSPDADGVVRTNPTTVVKVSTSRRNRAAFETGLIDRDLVADTRRGTGGLGLVLGACAILGVVATVVVVIVGTGATGTSTPTPIAQPDDDEVRVVDDNGTWNTPNHVNRDITPATIDPVRVWNNKFDQAQSRFDAVEIVPLISRERELGEIADICAELRAEMPSIKPDDETRKRLTSLTDEVIEAHGLLIIERIRERGDDLADLEDVDGLRRLIERVRTGDPVLFGSETVATDDRYAWMQVDLNPMLAEWEELLGEVQGLAGPSMRFRTAWRRLRGELTDADLRDARLDAATMREVVNRLADLVRTHEGATRYPSDFLEIWNSLCVDIGDAIAEDGLTYARIYPARSADYIAWLDLARWYVETFANAAPTAGTDDVRRVLSIRRAGTYIAVGAELLRAAIGELINAPPPNLIDDFNATMRLYWQADQIRRLDQVARDFQPGFDASFKQLGDRLYRIADLMQKDREQYDDVVARAVMETYLFAFEDDDHPLYDEDRYQQVQRWCDARPDRPVDVTLRLMDYLRLQRRDMEDNLQIGSAPAWAWEFGAQVLAEAMLVRQDFQHESDRLLPQMELFGSWLISAALTDANGPFVERPAIARLIAARLDVVTTQFVPADHVQLELRQELLNVRQALEPKMRD